MGPIRVLVGLITLAYAAWTILEGALGFVGQLGPLPASVTAMLGHYMQLGAQPAWRPAIELVAGLAFGAAATRIMGSPRGAWRVFAFAAIAALVARWIIPLMHDHTVAALKALAQADMVILAAFALGLILYLALGQVKTRRVQPTVLAG